MTTTIPAPPLPYDLTPIVDPVLGLLADIVDDLESTRKANGNRLDHLTRDEADSDGRLRGLGYASDSPEVAHLVSLTESLGYVETTAVRELERRMRRHPLAGWVVDQKGVGNKQAARLLAAIGDPYLHVWGDDDGTLHVEPRTVGQLWAYCGHGDPARRRRKGMSQAEAFTLGSATAKMRVWNIANSMIKSGVRRVPGTPEKTPFAPGNRVAVSDWGQVYIDRRTLTAEHPRVDAKGEPWTDAHCHADALRVLGKQFLKALWLEARRLHGVEG